jgi:hypothetical protein
LAAKRKWTLLVLPDARVMGVAPASAAACSALVAWSRMGPSSASSCAWLGVAELADAGQPGEHQCHWVLGESSGDGLVEVGDGSQQGGKQVDLAAD